MVKTIKNYVSNEMNEFQVKNCCFVTTVQKRSFRQLMMYSYFDAMKITCVQKIIWREISFFYFNQDQNS